MRAPAISLRVAAGGHQGAYAFTCPECRFQVNRSANRKTVALLMAAGVDVERTEDVSGLLESAAHRLPIEDRSPKPDARAFTLDDVISFHFLLEDEEAIGELLSQDR